MNKLSIIGLFRFGEKAADGQSIKTRIVAKAIEESIGEEQVHKIDTFGWKKHPFRLFFNCIKAVCKSKNVVFLTDAGGIKVFPFLLVTANAFFRRTIHYVVIGGWLIHYVKDHKLLTFFLKKLDGIFVETSVMKNTMEGLGFQNIYLMPNFKELSPVSEDELKSQNAEPYRFCVFSRIMKEKGVECAVNAVQNINDAYGRTVCTLDMYGQVDANQIEWFDCLKQTFSDAVHYGGVVPFDQSVQVLKEYDLLLFPTQFYTEGIPGTIIDAYAAGVPVVASEWESVLDIVESGVTGVTYPFDEPEKLQECLIKLIEDPDQINDMRRNCLKKAQEYLPEAVIDILVTKLD